MHITTNEQQNLKDNIYIAPNPISGNHFVTIGCHYKEKIKKIKAANSRVFKSNRPSRYSYAVYTFSL